MASRGWVSLVAAGQVCFLEGPRQPLGCNCPEWRLDLEQTKSCRFWKSHAPPIPTPTLPRACPPEWSPRGWTWLGNPGGGCDII